MAHIGNEIIENNFTYHTPTQEQVQTMQKLREQAKGLAKQIQNNVPDSREKSLAITKLEECIMWANAGIVRN